MTARDFLSRYRYDERLVTGAFYPQAPVSIDSGDKVGVVLMNHGGPERAEELESFLYNRLMDPAVFTLPVPMALRERFCRLLARRQARTLRKDYEQVGGGNPINRYTREQAAVLQQRLNDRFAALTGATFRTYIAMRYGQPASVDVAQQMKRDGIDKVVLLPLHPHYSKATTGSSLAYWHALEAEGTIPSWPTALIYEYAAHPKLIQAISERIDEGLQRFPVHSRAEVPLVFVAQGTARKDLAKHGDPYCCLVNSTVQQVMEYRGEQDSGRAFRVSFHGPSRVARSLGPGTTDVLEALADEGERTVLVVPISLVSDHMDTAHGLDIALREEAYGLGIEHFEVTNGLNCHPLFIEALAECVAAQVVPTDVARVDGADVLPTAIPTLPRYQAGQRAVRCATCSHACEARDWSNQPAVFVPAPRYPLPTEEQAQRAA
ncbi:MAG: ferrochelatase [Rhodothermaceae bacterium]|nr:ferrochelatase [Rhodothermaceae bacterium]